MNPAILITYEGEAAAGEARGLCDAAGYAVVHTVRQRFLGRPKFGISEEVLGRLESVSGRLSPDVLIFDEVLKPSQNYNLASALNLEVLDRERLILEIFERRASSAESRMQVRLAQLRYEMARAKEKVRLSSMGEQPGFMGIGKFGVDVYYNDIKHRMQSARSKLAKSQRQRELHRQGRRRAGFRTISLAGYTSAGKTTLFNRLTGEGMEEGSELFTTLSTTVRGVGVAGERFLLSDTVGFISKLPAYMIDAFKSTLEELGHADTVVVVVDASDPLPALRKKFASCMRTLGELGIERDRMVYALNKADLVDGGDLERKVGELNLSGSRRWVAVSARTGTNTARLKRLAREAAEWRGKRRAGGT